MARCRPAPEGWGALGLLDAPQSQNPWLCFFVAPSQKPKSPPANGQFIFSRTLKQHRATLLGKGVIPGPGYR